MIPALLQAGSNSWPTIAKGNEKSIVLKFNLKLL